MSFVVLFSTTSFAITKHFCGETLVDTAIFSKASTCGMESQKDILNPLPGCSIVKKDCCNDVQTLIDGQDELKLQAESITFQQQVFIASFVYSYSNLFEGLESTVPAYEDYKSPLVSKQIFKLDQTYLI